MFTSLLIMNDAAMYALTGIHILVLECMLEILRNNIHISNITICKIPRLLSLYLAYLCSLFHELSISFGQSECKIQI